MKRRVIKKSNEDWMNKKWRPAMGWMYMAICIFDFIVFPIAWAVFKAFVHEKVEPWEPLTLQGAGLFHMAMGAVLGIAAWSRGREKIAGTHYDQEEYNTHYTSVSRETETEVGMEPEPETEPGPRQEPKNWN